MGNVNVCNEHGFGKVEMENENEWDVELYKVSCILWNGKKVLTLIQPDK